MILSIATTYITLAEDQRIGVPSKSNRIKAASKEGPTTRKKSDLKTTKTP